MDKVTIKNELIDPLSWAEGQSSQVSKFEEYLEESLDDHQNDVDGMSLSTRMSLRKKFQDLNEVKENSLFEFINIKEEPSFDATGEEKIVKIEEYHVEGLESFRFDYGTLDHDAPNENHNINTFSSSNDEGNEDDDTKLLMTSDGEGIHHRSSIGYQIKEKNLIKSTCSQCDYKTANKSHLVRHLKTHTGERPFSCPYCDYKGNQKGNFMIHLKTHTGEKCFSCSYCDYKATRKCNLITHLTTHSDEKTFYCSYCDYKAKRNGLLLSHLKTHTGEKPFSCSYCEYKAIEKRSLMTHLRTHTGEKPFSCSYCSYKANQKNNLLRHLKSHTEEKPFSCPYCHYTTNQKGNLVRHLKRHTGT